MRGLFLVAAGRGHSSSRCAGLSLSRPLLLPGTGSRRAGSVVVAHLTGPVAPQHVGSSQTRAQTRVPCIGRQTLNHCPTREAPRRFLRTTRFDDCSYHPRRKKIHDFSKMKINIRLQVVFFFWLCLAWLAES